MKMYNNDWVTFKNFKFTIKKATLYSLASLFLLEAACAGPTVVSNYLTNEKKPEEKKAFLERVLTKEELSMLTNNFYQNPSQYSQEMGKAVFSKIN